MSQPTGESTGVRVAQPLLRVTGLSAEHPLLSDLSISLGVAGLSVVGLSTQHRLHAVTLVFCGALCAPLLLHRLSHRLCFAAVAVVALTQWLLSGPQSADLAVLIALYWLVLDGSLTEGVLAGTVVELGAIMAALRWSYVATFKVWVGLTGLATAAGVLGITIRQRRALLVSLHERAARLEVERDQEGRLAAAAERARIAREMHDIVAHNLSVMIALADGATYAMEDSPASAAQATRRVSATGREALDEMRRLLGVLHDGSPEQPLEPQPSLDRLDELLERVQAAGIPVTMQLDGDPRALTDGVQLTVFRIAQEALTNTLKHAARPARAHLMLSCRSGQVELEVTDVGSAIPGAPARSGGPADGRGLRGMQERAAAYGGRVDAGPAPDGGWRVLLRLHPDARLVTP
jgi:signal transduction histidine kinase